MATAKASTSTSSTKSTKRAKGDERYWLMKSELDVYCIDDLARDGVTSWEGVRNYQARNSLRDDMREGDLVLYYHSNASPPGVAGIGRVASAPYADPTQFDDKSAYHDPKSKKDAPTWVLVDVGFVEKLPSFVPLETLKQDAKLEGMLVVQKGQRLSVQPVDVAHFRRVLTLGKAKTKA